MRYFVICWIGRLNTVQLTWEEAEALIAVIRSRTASLAERGSG